MPRAVVAALAVVTAATLLLRTGILDSGYWIDEAITVGIASHDAPRHPRPAAARRLAAALLPAAARLDGARRHGEAATRTLPLLFALLAVPVAWWAGDALFGRRAGSLAAVGAAGCPFLTYYAQETRMYSLVAVLSVLACASFALAFLHGRRRTCGCSASGSCCCSTRTTGRSSWPAGWRWRGCGCGGRAASRRATARCSRPASRSPTRRGCRACSSRPPTRRRRGPRARTCCTSSASPAGCSATWRCRCWRWRRSPRCGAGRCRRACGCSRWSRPSPPARVPRLAVRAGVGDALPRGPVRPAAARARRGAGARGGLDVAGARGRGRRVARVRPRAGQEQRAHGGDDGRARAAARRPRGLHPAGAGAGALPLPAGRAALPHPARAGRRAAGDRLARRRRAAARRAARARARAAPRPALAAAAACCWSCRSTSGSPRRRGTARSAAARASGGRWLRAHPRLRSLGRAPRSTWPRRRSGVRTELFVYRR